ncbi:hypothetical protein B7463_g4560, partial [Scytalidium lignicola]
MSHLDADEFDGWDTYPQNLGLSLLDIDASRIDRRISQLTKELFVDKDESTFRWVARCSFSPNPNNRAADLSFQTAARHFDIISVITSNTSPGTIEIFPKILSLSENLSEDWRDYLVFLEEEFTMLVDRGFYTNIKGPQFEGDLEADYSDFRKLQILTDKLQRLSQILSLNIRLGHQMKDFTEKNRRCRSVALRVEIDSIPSTLDKFLYEQTTSLDRIKTLITRSAGINQLVQGILDIRANSEMQKLTEQGIKENVLMKQLTQQSTKDARFMTVIALITTIFLPATFLASLFGSNFFVYSQDGNKLTVASNFWIYIVFTAGFSGMAVVLWFLWKRRSVSSREADDLEIQ